MSSSTTERAQYMLGYGWGLVVGGAWGTLFGAALVALGVYMGWKA